MTYNVVFDVEGPIGMYDGMHAVVRQVMGEDDVGLLVHVGRVTDTGFQVLEIWRSKDAYDRFTAEIWPKVAAMLGGGLPAPSGTEFELRGLVVAATERMYV